MANPNIVSVTSIYGESIGRALTTTLTQDILTVASDRIVKVNYIQVCNTHASTAVAVTIAIVRGTNFTLDGAGSGEDNTGTFYLAKTVNLPADDVLVVLDKPLYLLETDILEGGSDPATADIFVSYESINDA